VKTVQVRICRVFQPMKHVSFRKHNPASLQFQPHMDHSYPLDSSFDTCLCFQSYLWLGIDKAIHPHAEHGTGYCCVPSAHIPLPTLFPRWAFAYLNVIMRPNIAEVRSVQAPDYRRDCRYYGTDRRTLVTDNSAKWKARRHCQRRGTARKICTNSNAEQSS
jgi:hypothetical protein